MAREKHPGIAKFKALHRSEGRSFVSLESMAALLAVLGNPERTIPAIHIGGTNGKGSVAAMVAAMFAASGRRVGQTSSPHLWEVAERCLIDGRPARVESFGENIERVVAAAESHGIPVSYFVVALAASYLEFAARGVQVMVVEVGVGGADDATNTLEGPLATAITSVSRDHTELLGSTECEIAEKKAGIAKRGTPLYVGRVSAEAAAAIRRVATRGGAPAQFCGEDFYWDSERSAVVLPGRLLALELEKLALPGSHQRENAVLAAAIAAAAGCPDEAIQRGLETVRWPGRLEWLRLPGPGCDLLFDVAHNPGGFTALTQYLGEVLLGGPYRRVALLCSILARKDHRQMLAQLVHWIDSAAPAQIDLVFTDSGAAAVTPPDVLASECGRGRVALDPVAALREICLEADPSTLIVVTGSIALVGRLRTVLLASGNRAAPFQTIVRSFGE